MQANLFIAKSEFQIRLVHSQIQHLCIRVLGNVDRAKGLQVFGGELRIEQHKSVVAQSLNQMNEADFRGVGAAGIDGVDLGT